jgi:DtxR family transcriptional regulator, Mn-dependent transcriptional regulator
MRTFCGLTTDSMLDYLVAIYKVDRDADKVTTSVLAERMHVSAAAVSSMLKRLEETNLVNRSSTDGVVLTRQGRLAALLLLRRHRLLEVFLTEVMGYTWDQVDVEAHRLEHAISDAFEERMDEMCGFPTHCPHGDPIPTKSGKISLESQVSLTQMQPGQIGVLRRIHSDDPLIFRYLSRLQLVPGQLIRLVELAPFSGPVTIERLGDDGRCVLDTLILGTELASLLFVRLAGQKSLAPSLVLPDGAVDGSAAGQVFAGIE